MASCDSYTAVLEKSIGVSTVVKPSVKRILILFTRNIKSNFIIAIQKSLDKNVPTSDMDKLDDEDDELRHT